MINFKSFLLLIIVLILLFPAFQKKTGYIRTKPLNGYYSTSSKPSFSFSSWMKRSYQEQFRVYLEESVGFKSDFVRLYNQIDYSLFSIPHASKIVVGKSGYLFSDSYIQGYLGTDFVGKHFIREKVKNALFLQDYLWKEKGILLILVFAPGKGYYYPEYIPSRYLESKKENTNHEYFVTECINNGVNHIDFNRWLLLMKDTSRYILYPKTGIHWSNYAAILCADSLTKYIEKKLNQRLPRIIMDSVELSKVARGEDEDIDRTMNLIWRIPTPLMAYPHFHYSNDSGCVKPKTLFVGDSFYWNWNYNDFIGKTFSSPAFWYYNQDVYPEHFKTPTNTGNLDYIAEILSRNVIILLQTNGAYGDIGYGWVDLAYDFLYPGPSRTKEIENSMRASSAWMESLTKKAGERGITTEMMMRKDAIFLMNQELQKNPKNR